MAYFSAQGMYFRQRQPPDWPSARDSNRTTFAALLYSRLSGHSRRRAEEIINTDPNRASGAVWSVAAQAAADGVTTSEQFEAWLQREEQPSQP
jgi:hypothetical protein